MIKIVKGKWNHPDFIELVTLLDMEFRERYGDAQNEYEKHNSTGPATRILIIYKDKNPVGCGAFRVINNDTVEIKRMFVKKEFRGKGISRIILTGLEELAVKEGFKTSILETGIKQQEAIALYKNSGYGVTESYGPYAELKFSICMSKRLNQ